MKNIKDQDKNTKQKKSATENPPLAAQVLYALGFLGLIGGLLMSIVAFASSSETDSLNIIGLSSLDIKLAAIILAILVVSSFTLINFIRGGKKWALISYTTIATLSITSSLTDYLLMSDFEKRLNDASPITSILPLIILGSILSILWTKNRSYFK